MAFEPLDAAVGSLLAQADVLRGLGRPFRATGDGPEWSTYLFVAVAVALAYFAARRAIASLQRRSGDPVDRPSKLFRELCRAHDLTWGEVAMLRALAEHWKLDNPSLLFIEPTRFEIAGKADARRLQPERLAALRIQLFGHESAPEYMDPII